jgi:hypothetical protein
MKRYALILILAVLVAVGILYGLRRAAQTPPTAVSSLLPRETIFVAHVPDFRQTRERWHHSDLYALYREPALQEFLRKPLARLPKQQANKQTLQDIEQLDPKDAFVAFTSVNNNNPTFVGGFRFRGTQDRAEAVVSKLRTALVAKNPNAKREKSVYQQHEIETIAGASFALSTAYDGHWFFASSDVAELKTLLDRADRRTRDRQDVLEGHESYRAALAHMPSSYEVFFYLQPKVFAEKLAALRAAVSKPLPPDQRTMVEKMRAVCGATRFEGGKIHDVLFVGMPILEQNAKLERSSLALTTKDTCFYLATLLNIGHRIEAINQKAGLGGKAQQLVQRLSASGITSEDWSAAFGLELGALTDWPANSHWPSLLVVLPVKDTTKAEQIVEALTKLDEDATWTRTEKNGVRFFSMQSPASLIAIKPTIALSSQMLVTGLDQASAEATMKRAESIGADLSSSQTYTAAARTVPAPTNFFTYIDTAMLYTRLDATLRPMLLMSAAFMPAVNNYVDSSKLPPPEAVTKHLSPIVSSQRYDRDGYVAESVGPVTLTQAAIALGVPAVLWRVAYGHD